MTQNDQFAKLLINKDMPKTLEPPQAKPPEATRREAEDAYREMVALVQSAVSRPKPWTADDVQGMLPTIIRHLLEAVSKREMTEAQSLELLRGFLAAVVEWRIGEHIDSALSGIKFPQSDRSLEGVAYYDRRPSPQE